MPRSVSGDVPASALSRTVASQTDISKQKTAGNDALPLNQLGNSGAERFAAPENAPTTMQDISRMLNRTSHDELNALLTLMVSNRHLSAEGRQDICAQLTSSDKVGKLLQWVEGRDYAFNALPALLEQVRSGR